MYYVTTGKWVGDQNLTSRIDSVVDDLKATNLFRSVVFEPIDATRIQKLTQQSQSAVNRDFIFKDRVVLPDMPGVAEASLGVLPASVYLGLVTDETGGILKGIFYDNVRDWQQYNPVNSEMRDTLQDEESRARFCLMNNGVTLIAKTLSSTGNRFHIEDYQVVNGCQTSHVLFDQRDTVDDTVYIPLRLIATDNEDVVASIIKATNRQTEVKAEQLIALSEFQKRLEAFFVAYPTSKRLYYERRSRQYASDTGVEKTRILTPGNLIRAYAAVIQGEPHRTTRSYRTLLQALGTSIFGPDHKLEPYFLAGSALYRLEYLYRNNILDSKYRPARYHILYAARLLMSEKNMPLPQSNKIVRYVNPMIEKVWNTNEADKLFALAAKAVESAAHGDFHRDNIRTQGFTERVEAEAESLR